jgi:glycerol-3-phosphate cytidylyltransferase
LGLKVYTGGTFDLFHSGHVNFLKRCQQIAGVDGQVVVALNTDEFIYDYKKKKPVLSFDQRKDVLESCRYVSEVVANVGGSDSKKTIEMVESVDVIAIGSDWARKDYYAQMEFDQDWLDEKNISLIYIPYTKGISSTFIKGNL